MKIGKIGDISFQRAIKVNSSSNRIDEYARVNSSTRAVFNTLCNSALPDIESIYDEETSEKIKDFLKAQIKDFNNNTGFLLRKINGEIYVFTGQEVEIVRQADKKLSQKNNNLQKERDKKLSEETSSKVQKKIQRRYKLEKEKYHSLRDCKLLELVEPSVEININMNENDKAKVIEYVSPDVKNTLIV